VESSFVVGNSDFDPLWVCTWPCKQRGFPEQCKTNPPSPNFFGTQLCPEHPSANTPIVSETTIKIEILELTFDMFVLSLSQGFGLHSPFVSSSLMMQKELARVLRLPKLGFLGPLLVPFLACSS
jgi:hypothetical protein